MDVEWANDLKGRSWGVKCVVGRGGRQVRETTGGGQGAKLTFLVCIYYGKRHWVIEKLDKLIVMSWIVFALVHLHNITCLIRSSFSNYPNP